MGLRGIKSYNLRTLQHILMKFGQKLQKTVCRILIQLGILEKSRLKDNPHNPLEKNRIKKTKGFRA